MLIRNRVKCLTCNTIVESINGLVTCSCGATSLSGGRVYHKVCTTANTVDLSEYDYSHSYQRWLALPDDFKIRCCQSFVKSVPLDVQSEIRKAIRERPLDWYIPYHLLWGMQVRNLFRAIGIKDNELPSGNWDDYYYLVVEYALDERQL